MAKRLNLYIDDKSLARLQSLQEKTEAKSLAAVIAEALRIYGAIIDHREHGYSVVKLMHPKTKRTRELIL